MVDINKLQRISVDKTAESRKLRKDMKESFPQRRYNASIAVRLLKYIDDTPGMNKSRLAGRLGVSSPYISRVINGKENLTLDTVERYESILDIQLLPSSLKCDDTGATAFITVSREEASLSISRKVTYNTLMSWKTQTKKTSLPQNAYQYAY